MNKEITFQKPVFKSWVKLIAISSFTGFIPFGTIMGILAFFGLNTVSINGEHYFNFSGLFAGIVIGAVIATIVTILLGVIGYWGILIYSKYKNITLKYIE